MKLGIKDAKKMIRLQISILENDIAHNRTYGFRALKEFLIDNDHRMRLLIDTSQGTLEKTDNNLDVAISGSCFIKIGVKAQGYSITRNGQFRINSERNLYHLLNPEISLNLPMLPACTLSSVQIDQTGQINCTDDRGKKLATGNLEILVPIDQGNIKKSNATIYTYTGGVIRMGQPGFDCAINPGYLENSNTDVERHLKRIKTLQDDLKLLPP